MSIAMIIFFLNNFYEIDFINFIVAVYCRFLALYYKGTYYPSCRCLFHIPSLTYLIRWEPIILLHLRNKRLEFYSKSNVLTSYSTHSCVKSSHYSYEIGYILCIRYVEIFLSSTYRYINHDFSHNCC